MMRSMYSGVSGLRNHQIRMDVIGNNIANINTAGFKKSRVVFTDKLYQAVRGASSPTADRGGTNPMAVGLGMAISSIDQIHNPAPTTITNNTYDMALDGDGYFILRNSDGTYSYTRSGAFSLDELRTLVNSGGSFVQGWLADEDGIIDTSPSRIANLDFSPYEMMAPRATENMILTGNLNSDMEVATLDGDDIPTDDGLPIFSEKIYDSLGNEVILYFRFFKTDANEWSCDISLNPTFDDELATPAAPPDATGNPVPAGNLDSAGNASVRVNGITFTSTGKLDTTAVSGVKLIIPRAAEGAGDIETTIDISKITQYQANESTVKVDHQDGNFAGTLVTRSVGGDGVISASYSNGETRKLGQVAVATFKNPQGLIQAGDNQWVTSANSGNAEIGVAGSGSRGAVIPGSLEMSNVDLSEEFTDMIITQRGFSANSRIITTSDEMLQELVNLKR